MRIRWSPEAAADLYNIKTYLDQHNPDFSESTVRTIYQRILSLKNSPHRFRRGYAKDTREMPLVPLPYPVVYEIKSEVVEIHHIHHASQNWQSGPPLN